MPKSYLNINNFGLGINNVKNPRDLKNGESANLENFNVSKRFKKLIGVRYGTVSGELFNTDYEHGFLLCGKLWHYRNMEATL